MAKHRFDIGKKVVQAPFAGGRFGWTPSFIVDAPQKNRQLSPEMDGVLRSNTIAQGVEARSKRRIGLPPVVCLQLGHDDPQPVIGFVNRPVECVESCRAHPRLSISPPTYPK